MAHTHKRRGRRQVRALMLLVRYRLAEVPSVEGDDVTTDLQQKEANFQKETPRNSKNTNKIKKTLAKKTH